MRRFRLNIALSVLLMSTMVSCDRRPDNVLSDKDAASLLADLHIADAYGTLEGAVPTSVQTEEQDSDRRVLRQGIMRNHGVSEAQFDTTLGWYGHNLDKYEDMYELVLENITARQQVISKINNDAKSSIPSYWPYMSNLRLSATAQAPLVLPFDIPADKIEKGSRIIWEGKIINMREPIEVFLATEYSDGSMKYIQRTLMGSMSQNITLQTDSSQRVTNAYGYVRVRQRNPVMLDSVNIRISPLIKTTYYEIHSAKTWMPRKSS